jgi:hypothetical protein
MEQLVVRLFLILLLSTSMNGPASASVASQGATPQGSDVTILDPDTSYAGASRGEWAAWSWQWGVSLPPVVNPGEDQSGERCGYGQSGPVFFMAANVPSYTITCVVPEGTAIFVGLGSVGCSTVEPPPFFGRDEASLRACAAAAMDGVTYLRATVDGQRVPDPERYRYSSPPFTLNIPEDNILGAPAGVALSVADGYGFIIAPPPPGEYEITFMMIFEIEGIDVVYQSEGRYRVIVEAPQIIEPVATPGGATPAGTPNG